MRRFYSSANQIREGRVILSPEETRHLRDVLRLRAGDEASVFDGLGNEYLCTIADISERSGVLDIVRRIEPPSPESPLDLTVAAAILPGEKFEIAVEKAAELGVRTFQPLFTRRCEVKPGGSSRRIERWQKIAIGSAKQSGRATLMQINEPFGISDLFRQVQDDKTGTSLVFFSEREGSGFEAIRPAGKMLAVFGPKGGWEDEEIEKARQAGFTIVTVGGRVVRAETAAIAMTAILLHRFGDVN